MRFVPIAFLLLSLPNDVRGQPSPQPPQDFMGRKVTVIEAELDEDGFHPKGPASVCLEGPPLRQCYTAPKDFGRLSKVSVIQTGKQTSALLFSAGGGGVSGWMVHFALLQPAPSGDELENLFFSDMNFPNQNQYAFWTDSPLDGTPIFLIAKYVWGEDEGHYGPHRYIISVYSQGKLSSNAAYHLMDEYMTVRRYIDNEDILAAEKQEILSRLERLNPGGQQ